MESLMFSKWLIKEYVPEAAEKIKTMELNYMEKFSEFLKVNGPRIKSELTKRGAIFEDDGFPERIFKVYETFDYPEGLNDKERVEFLESKSKEYLKTEKFEPPIMVIPTGYWTPVDRKAEKPKNIRTLNEGLNSVIIARQEEQAKAKAYNELRRKERVQAAKEAKAQAATSVPTDVSEVKEEGDIEL
jgi:hypothetical protein